MFSFLQHRAVVAVALFALVTVSAIVFHGVKGPPLSAQVVTGPGGCYFNGNYTICNCTPGGTCTYSGIGSGGPYGIYCQGSGGSPYTSITFGPSSDACANNQIVDMGCANGELAPACMAGNQCIVHPGYSWMGWQNVFGYVGDGVYVPKYGMSAYACLTSTHCDTNNLTVTISCPAPPVACSSNADCSTASDTVCKKNKCISGTCQMQNEPVDTSCSPYNCGDPAGPSEGRCNAGGACVIQPLTSCTCVTGSNIAKLPTSTVLATAMNLSIGSPVASLIATAGVCTNNDSTNCNFPDSCNKVEYTNTWSGPGCCDGGGTNTMILTADPGQNYATLDFHDACNGAGTGTKQVPVCPCDGSSSSASSQSSPSSGSSSFSSSSRSPSSSSRSSSTSSISSTSSHSSSTSSSDSSQSSSLCTSTGHRCADCTSRTICVTCPNAGPNDACTQSCTNFIVVNRYPDGGSCVPCTVTQVLNEPPACPTSASSHSSTSSASSPSSNSSGSSTSSRSSSTSSTSSSSSSSNSSSTSSTSSSSSRSSSSNSSTSSSSSMSSNSSSTSSTSSTSSSSSSSSSNSSSTSSISSTSSRSSSSTSSTSSSSSHSSTSSLTLGYCCIGLYCGGPIYGCSIQSCDVCEQIASSRPASSTSSHSSQSSHANSSSSQPEVCPLDACNNQDAQAYCASVGLPVCSPLNDLPCIRCSAYGSASSSNSVRSTSLARSRSSSSIPGCLNICGNGHRECAEECDDGNTKNNDGCNGSCKIEGGECGDGIIESLIGENCEPVLTDPSTDCNGTTCRLSHSSSSLRSIVCGNGHREGTEECDDGALNGGTNSICNKTCHRTQGECGNGVVESLFGEDCEPSLLSKTAPFKCTADCHYVYKSASSKSSAPLVAEALCTGQECGEIGNDFCNAQQLSCVSQGDLPCFQCIGAGCKSDAECPEKQMCRDGACVPRLCEKNTDCPLSDVCKGQQCVTQTCTNSTDCRTGVSCAAGACTPDAVAPAFVANLHCGDGKLNPGEQCDDGVQNSLRPNAFCRPDCTFGRCGDAVIDTPLETCDDGSQNGLLTSSCDAFCHSTHASAVLPATVIELPFNPSTPFTNPPEEIQGSTSVTASLTAMPPSNASSGPATLAIMAMGAAAGYSWMRRKR